MIYCSVCRQPLNDLEDNRFKSCACGVWVPSKIDPAAFVFSDAQSSKPTLRFGIEEKEE